MRSLSFTATGVASTTVDATQKLTSPEGQRRKCVGVLLNVSGQVGNRVIIHLNQTKVFDVYDYSISCPTNTAAVNIQSPFQVKQQFDLEEDVNPGDELVISIVSGATEKNLFGSWLYDIQ